MSEHVVVQELYLVEVIVGPQEDPSARVQHELHRKGDVDPVVKGLPAREGRIRRLGHGVSHPECKVPQKLLTERDSCVSGPFPLSPSFVFWSNVRTCKVGKNPNVSYKDCSLGVPGWSLPAGGSTVRYAVGLRAGLTVLWGS